MRFFFSILRLAFFLLLLLLLIALFLPSNGHVERSLLIRQVPEVPYNLVNCLASWESWSPWHKLDKAMKVRYAGPSEGRGASCEWTSEHPEVGNGRQTIVDCRAAEYILMEMDFARGGPARCGFYFLKTDAGTEVKWTLDSEAGWNLPARYFILLMDFFVGPHFEDGLARLAAESQKAEQLSFTMGFEQTEFPAVKALGVRIKCRQPEMSAEIQAAYSRILSTLPSLQLQVSGPPFALYEALPENGLFRFIAGMPVDRKPRNTGSDGLVFFEVPAGKALLCRFNGAYNQISKAYEKFPAAMKSHGLTPAGGPMEIYLNDPSVVKNPLEIRTEIYWPVR